MAFQNYCDLVRFGARWCNGEPGDARGVADADGEMVRIFEMANTAWYSAIRKPDWRLGWPGQMVQSDRGF